jgi:hypothetical protein
MLPVLAMLLTAPQCPAFHDAPPRAACHYVDGTNPDPNCTPGDSDTDDVKVLCDTLTKERRCKPDKALRRALLQAYDVPGAGEIDHLVPLCLGGSNSGKNLWPQQKYKAKDKQEALLCRAVCSGKLSLGAARILILDPKNWK